MNDAFILPAKIGVEKLVSDTNFDAQTSIQNRHMVEIGEIGV